MVSLLFFVFCMLESNGKGQDVVNTNPVPVPRARTKKAPNPRPRSVVSLTSEDEGSDIVRNKTQAEEAADVKIEEEPRDEEIAEEKPIEAVNSGVKVEDLESEPEQAADDEEQGEDLESKIEAVNPTMAAVPEPEEEKQALSKISKLAELQKQSVAAIFNTETFTTTPEEKAKPPEVVAFYPKTVKTDRYSKSIFDSYTRKRGFQIGSSLLDEETSGDLSTPNSVASALDAFDFVDELEGSLDVEMFTGSLSKNSKNKNIVLNELHGMHELETLKKDRSGGSLRSVSSVPGFMGSNMKKWHNVEELDDISLHSSNGHNAWVIGDTSDTESVASATNALPESKPKETEEVPVPVKVDDLDWHYQLPSPPKAFRDSSPVAFAQESLADSVVTSPELFEKLKEVKDAQSETVSDLTSVVSEEEKPILNKLSLENLEKRKSLVYNRELATSLKMADEEKKDGFSSSLTKFEKTYEEVRRSSPKEVGVQTRSTLPNFKITTYDNPKQKVNIFEDDTIRSNSGLDKGQIGRSMENISFRKNSDGDFKKPKFYKPPAAKPQFNVHRSESFSKEQTWVPQKPVTRSVSQVALNKYKDNKNLARLESDDKSKSSSLFDVSGLQSLGVMRLIQNKLNTPNNSTEELDKESYQEQPVKTEVQKPIKSYRVPSINMGTWSERPKVPVNVKEDPDYKFGIKDTRNNSKLIVNTVNNDIKSYNSIEVRNKPTNGVSLRVNETISGQNTENVTIKIGPTNRKPLGNVNGERPHSIAFGSDFDISRVPIVRSVEFKKPFKDPQNTSITQIYQNNNTENRTTEAPQKPQIEVKPVFRVNSYLQNSSAPVVRGFRSANEPNRKSWGQPHSFSTLPAKNFATNRSVPFSQSNLRRTESTKAEKGPPAPPTMPVFGSVKTADLGDPKEQLLQAIRDFGGKKGLRAVKA